MIKYKPKPNVESERIFLLLVNIFQLIVEILIRIPIIYLEVENLFVVLYPMVVFYEVVMFVENLFVQGG